MVVTHTKRILIILSIVSMSGTACGDEVYPSAFPTDESLCSFLEEHSDCLEENCVELVCHEPCSPISESSIPSLVPSVLATESAIQDAKMYCESVDDEVKCNYWEFETCEFESSDGETSEFFDFVHCRFGCIK